MKVLILLKLLQQIINIFRHNNTVFVFEKPLDTIVLNIPHVQNPIHLVYQPIMLLIYCPTLVAFALGIMWKSMGQVPCVVQTFYLIGFVGCGFQLVMALLLHQILQIFVVKH